MEYKNESFIIDLADGYSDETFNEAKVVYAKAHAFDEVVPLIREQFIQATVNYCLKKYYNAPVSELEEKGEELIKIQKIVEMICEIEGVTIKEFVKK